jgi:imidazolonepropionase-like amidohydrolase
MERSSAQLVLVGGTVYPDPDEPPIHDGVVLIRDGTIAAVGPRDAVEIPAEIPSIDCSGGAIVSGFWNSHVHLFERKWANASTLPAPELARQIDGMLTRHGFTSAFDTGSMWENTRALRDRIESGEVPGPMIRSTGEALVAPGAMPSDRILGTLGFMSFPAPEVASAAEAAEAARKLLAKGVDGIKVHLQPPPPPAAPLPEAAMASAVAEAHSHGKPAFAHPNTAADVRAAVRAGVDVIAHTTPRSGPWDEALVAAMKEADVALTPTLTLWRSAMRHDRASVQERLTATAVNQLRSWVDAGGTVLFGTDAGAVDDEPIGEYELMSEAGLGFREILAALTVAPAARFGEAERRGRVAVGLEADLVVLRGDPSEDIRRLGAVQYTVRAGRIVHRSTEP